MEEAGRTNTVERPLACIITSSAWIMWNTWKYHPGNCREKAGIIKPGVPVIYDGHVPEASAVIEKQAEKLGSPAYADRGYV